MQFKENDPFDPEGDKKKKKKGAENKLSSPPIGALLESLLGGGKNKEDGDLEVIEIEEDFDDDEVEFPAECPVSEALDDLLSMTFDPKPFGVTWTSKDIIKFLKLYGYTVTGDEPSPVNKVMAYPGNLENPPKQYNPEYDYKKVFIDLCREKSIQMLLKKFREIDDNNNTEA